MPNRIFREGLLRSPRVHHLSPGAHVLYTRLLLVADDYGRFPGSPTTIRAACWPLDPDKVRPSDVSKSLTELLKGDDPLIKAYNLGGIAYVEIQNFKQSIRSASKYPNPPWYKKHTHTENSATHDAQHTESITGDSGATHSASASASAYSSASALTTRDASGDAVVELPNQGKTQPKKKSGSGSKKRSGADIEKSLGERLPWFNRCWEKFPKAGKDNKRGGMEAFDRKVSDYELAKKVYFGVLKYAAKIEADPTRRVKYFQGWINDERWDDESEIETSSVNGSGNRPMVVPAAADQRRSETLAVLDAIDRIKGRA